LDVTIGGFTVGANGTWRSNGQSASGADHWVAGIGGTCNWDAWTVGLAWSHGDHEYFDSGNASDKIDIVQLTGRYDIGPAISLDAMVGCNSLDAGSGTGHADDDTWEAGIGFYLGF
jgi:outer membrane protein OmpU